MWRSNIKLIVYIIVIIAVAGCNTLSEEEKEKFREAIKNDDRKYIEYILAMGVDLNDWKVFGYVPLYIAAGANNIELIELFLKHGADINSVDGLKQNCLFKAYNINTVRYLIEHGANVNQVDVNEDTPLLNVAWNYDLAKIYIENGSDINHKDQHGNTVFLASIIFNNIKLVRYLIKNKKININEINDIGSNALMLLLFVNKKRKEDNDVISLLITEGININHQNNYGHTALHEAVRLGYKKEIIKLLLDNGADVHIKNKKGKTALDMAIERGDKDIVNLLKMCARK